MVSRRLSPGDDQTRPGPGQQITIMIDGEPTEGFDGQTIAGLMLSNGRLSWRRSSVADQPRGLFCGIGICFDCLVVVNGDRDVRACQRRAIAGDVIELQHDILPGATRATGPTG